MKEKLWSHHIWHITPWVVKDWEWNKYHICAHMNRVSSYMTWSWIYYWLYCYSFTTREYLSKLLSTYRTTWLFLKKIRNKKYFRPTNNTTRTKFMLTRSYMCLYNKQLYILFSINANRTNLNFLYFWWTRFVHKLKIFL